MVLIPPINPYVASQLATQQAKPVTPPAHVVTAKPPTPPEKRERTRDKEKQHRQAEQEAEDEAHAHEPRAAAEADTEKRGKLTDIEA
jgi:hypothetical protein